MKSLMESILKESILKESILKESILSQVGGGDRYFDDLIRKYGLNPKKIIWNKDGSIDYDGDVNFRDKDFTKIPIKFNKITGSFYCNYCNNLLTLEGAPQEVEGHFYCYDCNNLLSLKGAPQEVGGCFNCSNCVKLKTLKGCPKQVGGYFDCSWCGKRFTKEEIREYCNVRKEIYV